MHSLSFTLRSCCTLLSFSPSLDLKAFFFLSKYFQVTGDPGLVVREAAYSPGQQGGVFTEFDVFCDAVCHAVDVLPVWLTKHIKAVLQCLISLLSPLPHSPCGYRLHLGKRDILWCQQNQVLIRSAGGVDHVLSSVI